jgi:6,7-dimethyl-8-ribityllumazine synthase
MGKGISKTIGGIDRLDIRQVAGDFDADGLRFGIVASRFNAELVDELCRSAVQCLERHGVAAEEIDLFRVPGAYEIPVVAERLAAFGRYDALIVLGVVVEGETQHAQMIIDATGRSILDISCRHHVPVVNEIVGVRTWEQAEARCLGGEGSRGWYAAEAAIETARLYRKLG